MLILVMCLIFIISILIYVSIKCIKYKHEYEYYANLGYKTFLEYIDELNKTINKNNIFSPPLKAQVGLNYLTDYLLGRDWYTANPISTEQVNTEIVHEILYKYSRKYRKEYNKRKKNK